MLRQVVRCARSEEGVEILEWIAMGAIILAMALLVFPGSLGDTINTVMQAIGTKLST